MEGSGDRWFYKTYPPRKWPDHLCEHLRPVMAIIQARDPIKVAVLGLENVKAPELTCLLARRPTAATLSLVEDACASQPGLSVSADAVACREHYSAIEWSSPPPRPGWLERLGARLRS